MITSTPTARPAERSGILRILILDLKVEDIRRLRHLLEPEVNFRLQSARSVAEAKRALGTGAFDVALIESSLWTRAGASLERFVRDHHLDVAVILLAASNEAPEAARFGAHDVINKATMNDSHEMAARILAVHEETRVLRRRDTMVRWLEREACTDHLTGLLNRQAFDEQFAEACRVSQVQASSLALILIDVTGTRQVNKAYGQPTGDAMIRRTARAIARSVRGADIAARVGDDDFGIIVAGGDIDLGRRMARRVAREIERLNEEDLDGDIPVSVSFGVASGCDCGPDELFAAAGQQLSIQEGVCPALTPFFPRNDQDGPSVA